MSDTIASNNSPRLTTVMYHYVRDVENTAFPGIKGVSVADFRRQVALVKDKFATPPLEECLAFLAGDWTPEGDLCILTFDDGLIEHYETVTEILADARIPGAFFLPTAAIEDHEVLAVHMNHFLLAHLGTAALRGHVEKAAAELDIGFPPEVSPDQVRSVYRWDDEPTARLKYLINHQLPPDVSERILAHIFPDVLGPPEGFARTLYVSWDQARKIQEAGMHVGGHSHRHKVLANMDPPEQRSDLQRSHDLLRHNLGEGVFGFAYPYGKPATYTEQTIADLDEIGFACGFNTTVDTGQSGQSKWDIPRIDPKDLA